MEPILFDPQMHQHLLSHFADLHIACIEQDFTIATFIPPLSHDKTLKWWQQQADEVLTRKRKIFFMMASDDSSTLAGVVMLGKPSWETGPFRASVEKLLVSTKCRRMGVAKKLMLELERVAKEQGRTMLVNFRELHHFYWSREHVLISLSLLKTLDTEAGSPAEVMYPKMGYIKVGKIQFRESEIFDLWDLDWNYP